MVVNGYNPHYERDAHRRDERLETWLNRPKLYLELASGGVAVLAATLICFAPGWIVKYIGVPLLFSSAAAYGTAHLIHRNYRDALKEAIAAEIAHDRAALERSEGAVQHLKTYITQIETAANAQILHWQQQANGLQTSQHQLQALQQQWQTAQQTWAATETELDNELRHQDQQITSLEDRIGAMQAAQAAMTTTLLLEGKRALDHALRDLDDSLQTQVSQAIAQNAKLKPQLTAIAHQSKAILDARTADANALSDTLTATQLITELIDLLRQATREISALKIKVRNTLNTGNATDYLNRIQTLETQLEQCIPRSQHDAILSEYQGSADGLTHEATERLQQLQHQAQSADSIISELNREIEHWQAIAQQLQQHNRQLQQPILFSPAIREDLRMGNAIIEYFYGLDGENRIILDRGGSEYRQHSATLYFHARDGQIIAPSAFNTHADQLQQVCRCLNVPHFKYDAESGLFSVVVELSRKPLTPPSEILKQIGTRDDFFRYLSNNPIRYRIIGDPGVGKTPLATQMSAYLSHQGAHDGNVANGAKIDRILISASYPNAESSRKDPNYPLTPFLIARNETECRTVIRTMWQDYQWRRTPQHTSFVGTYFSLWVIDEADNTLDLSSDGAASDLRKIMNDGGHYNLGWILLGQSVNTKKLRGWTNDDRKKSTEIIIGSTKIRAWVNAYGSEFYSPERLDALTKQLDKVEIAIEQENKAIADEAARLRLCLIADSRSPKLFLMPKFDAYEFNLGKLQQWQTEADNARNQLETAGIPLEFPSNIIQTLPHPNNGTATASTIPSTSTELPYGTGHGIDGIDGKTGQCPSCGETGKPKGKPVNGRQRYFCLNEGCDKKTFTATLEEAIR
jgi:hypothetical protein